MTDFKEQWDEEMAMTVLASKSVDSKLWAEAVEWLMLHGPDHIKEMLNKASSMATSRYFPELKPAGYSPDGSPLYDIESLAEALQTSPETLSDRLRSKEVNGQTRHLFSDDETQKIH
ncbi:MAG: hypothetical protein C0613_11400 [Desulfobulbaceae bacterium]|nr:MAG: hypothetical protein C0613_11400 [Desulfobulbaceae bacterium]